MDTTAVLNSRAARFYLHNVPYVATRVTMVSFGVLMVLLGRYTAVELGMSLRAFHIVTLMC